MPREVASGESRPDKLQSSGPLPGKPLPGRSMPGKPMPGRPVPGKPMPGKPMPGKPVPGKPIDARTQAEVNPPGKRRSTPGGPKPGAKSPGQSHQSLRLRSPQESGDQEPSPQSRPAGMIIGLDPKIAAQAGLPLSGRPRGSGPPAPGDRLAGSLESSGEGDGEDGL